MSPSLKVGNLAPEFKAKAYFAGQFKDLGLRDYHGKWVCLFFYAMDFTVVCPTELRSFAENEARFKELNCQVIGVSTDSEHCHKAWFERDLPQVKYPVLADMTRHVSSAYGVLIEEKGVALRGTFLIDPNGILQWMSVNALSVGRSIEEVIRVLEALQTGEQCPADWKKGKPTVKPG